MPCKCKTVSTQIRPDIMPGLIWVQTICKRCQHTAQFVASRQRVNLQSLIERLRRRNQLERKCPLSHRRHVKSEFLILHRSHTHGSVSHVANQARVTLYYNATFPRDSLEEGVVQLSSLRAGQNIIMLHVDTR